MSISRLTSVALAELAERGHFGGVRDDVEPEVARAVARSFSDLLTVSETPSTVIEPLAAMNGASSLRRGDGHAHRIALGRPVDHVPTASTWPVTICPPSSSPSCSAGSRLSRAPSRPHARGGAADGFARDVDREPCIARLAAAFDHGQAHARAGDRGADGDPRRVQRAGDAHAQVAALLDAARSCRSR